MVEKKRKNEDLLDNPEKKRKIEEAGDVTLKKPVSREEREIEDLKKKMKNMFREKWEKGLDKQTRDTIKENISKFLEETTEKVVAQRLVHLKKKGEERDEELSRLMEKRGAVPQDLQKTKTFTFITAFQTLKHTSDAQEAVKLIRAHGKIRLEFSKMTLECESCVFGSRVVHHQIPLWAVAVFLIALSAGFVREHVPTDLLDSQEVWAALLDDMPMTAMIRNLGKMASIGLLGEEEKVKSVE